ncbi:MAG: hypothetical protein EOO41_05490, partial [Methanobacteriota archaeon]
SSSCPPTAAGGSVVANILNSAPMLDFTSAASAAGSSQPPTPAAVGGQEEDGHHLLSPTGGVSGRALSVVTRSLLDDTSAAPDSKPLSRWCPSADRGGPSLGLWMEAARAVAYAAVRLSSVSETGDGVSPEYKSVLACALQLCSSCPLLREIVLRRILRKWPTGNSDNEVALLEFLATVLATTTHRADLVVTDLRSIMLFRILRCLQSQHIKVAKNALILVDPHRRLVDFLVDDELSMRRLIDALQANVAHHWSPIIQRASAACKSAYAMQLSQLRRAGSRGAAAVAAATASRSHPTPHAASREYGRDRAPSSSTTSSRDSSGSEARSSSARSHRLEPSAPPPDATAPPGVRSSSAA